MGLSFTKLFSDLFGGKKIQLVMVGLNFAGKTTILYKLQLSENVPLGATIGFSWETVRYKDNSLVVMEVGGQFRMGELTRHLRCMSMAGLIFVIDCNDRDRLADAKEDLHLLLKELKDMVVLVFANKQDCPNAMSPAEITDKLDLRSIQQKHWYVQGLCAISGEGLYEGMDWLINQIGNKVA